MKKDVKIIKSERLLRSLNITVDKHDYNQKYNSSLASYINNSSISGFRKGKAPKNVILAKYGKNIHADTLGFLINQSLREVLSEEDLHPASPHQINIIQEGSTESDLQYNVEFEIYPEFNLQNIDEITIDEPDVKISSDDVMNVIANIQKQHIKWDEKTNESTEGDKVIIDYQASIDSSPNDDLSRDNFTFIIGEKVKGDESTVSLFKLFYKYCVEKKKGCEVSFDFKMPSSHIDAKIAGKNITYKIKVKQVYTGVIPPLNNDLYTKLGLANSSDDQFKQSVSEQMNIELNNRIKQNMIASINDKLLTNITFDTPAYLLDDEVKNIRNQYEGMMREVDDKTAIELNTIALKRVRLNIIYRKIAEINKISATDQDAISYVSQSNDPKKDEILSKLRDDTNLANQIKHKIIEDGIIKLLISRCKKSKVKMRFNEIVN